VSAAFIFSQQILHVLVALLIVPPPGPTFVDFCRLGGPWVRDNKQNPRCVSVALLIVPPEWPTFGGFGGPGCGTMRAAISKVGWPRYSA